ncbi:deoxyribonuclease IV [Bombilactobacillus thymidiniphilus]|uniref:Probable endonuclease 4 n=1 Tax=Bombilactobacillus thymidiniphilus TaxID=2923363 RepID=A0ABY4PCW3_9LACO|nr:deoxyribonuclease IV [Bombilactobacillus thymidiniphilus]UQS83537.1 deoxyribonuclease IV [Bombilactobacillus thymidiniphilus]
MLLGAHVSMSGKKMLLGAAQEAYSYGANTMMIFTGAPQNTRRKDPTQMNIPAGQEYMKEHHIAPLIGHAPYIINLGNVAKKEKYEFAIEFMQAEVKRCDALGIEALSFHPGSHVGLGVDAALRSIAHGLEEILKINPKVSIALETMAGKGTEVGTTFEQLAKIIELTPHNAGLSITFDTCHTSDAGYDIKNDFDGVLAEFDHIIGLDRLSVIHLNDSKNPQGSHKDRHADIGFGTIGFNTLNYICHHPQLTQIPKIMETPYVTVQEDPKKTVPVFKEEITMLKQQEFDPQLIAKVQEANQ